MAGVFCTGCAELGLQNSVVFGLIAFMNVPALGTHDFLVVLCHLFQEI